MSATRLVKKILGPAAGLLLFSAALWVLSRELHTYRLSTIMHAWEALPYWKFFFAVSLTILNYTILTGYDFLALRFIKNNLAYHKIAFASFIGYAFSNNFGASMIAGATVRFRLYSGFGLSALDITRIIGFCTMTVWIGFFTLAGVVFSFVPMMLPKSLPLPFASVHLVGSVLLGLVIIFFSAGVLRKKPLQIGHWTFFIPEARLLSEQTVLSVLDWLIAAAVFYVLLPGSEHLTFMPFVGIFLVAQLAGLVSQIPGGLGVFDTVILVLLTPQLSSDTVVASILAYRAIYYLFPLLAATLMMGGYEILRKQRLLVHVTEFYTRWVTAFFPLGLSIAAFMGGALLLFSGATPATSQRLMWLKHILPLPFIEVSHFIGSLAGMGLLLLARGLQRRLDAAYVLTVILLLLGIAGSLLKGIDYEEALLLGGILIAILPSRHHFYRRASLLSIDFTAGWIGAVLIVILGMIWLGLFSYKHVEYSNQLWWKFAFFGQAPRFLRASIGAIGLAVLVAGLRLFRPSSPKTTAMEPVGLSEIAPIVKQSVETSANLAMLGDKQFLLNEKKNAFIMYAVEGRSWITMGDPVGPEEEKSALAWQFYEQVDRYGGWAVFYEVSTENLQIYLDLGLTLVKLGEEARVSLNDFSLDGSSRKGQRHTLKKLSAQGCTFEMLSPEGGRAVLAELQNISDAWMSSKQTREKRFSLGSFDPQYLQFFPVAVIRVNGVISAFANVWTGAAKEEVSIDLMRYLPDAPHGIMDYLMIRLMEWAKAEGYSWFNLGMAPLSGFENHELAPLWNRLGAMVARYGENFYNFKGLRQYKNKFDPVWAPKYLAYPGGLALPRIFINLATLVSGGLTGVIRK